jgi:protein O-GlcNAc transferase
MVTRPIRHRLTATSSHPSPTTPADPLKTADLALREGRPDHAERLLRGAKVTEKGVVPGMHMLAIALAQLRRFDEAEALWRRLLNIPGEERAVLPNLGRALDKAGRHDEALQFLSRAVALAPQDYVARINLAACLYSLGHFAQSREQNSIASALQPGIAQPHFNMGCAWEAELNFARAIACYEQALSLEPAHQEATRNRLFLEHFLPEITPQQRLAHACERGDEICRGISRMRLPARRRPGPLRVGLLSADFKAHPVGWFLGGFLGHIDPKSLELEAFNNGPRGDQVTEQLRRSFVAWHEIAGLGDAAVADLIEGRQIDILIELSGMTAGHGLGVLARKPAPIQVSWLGYFSSIGLPTIDWVLADPLCLPHGEEALYREKVWRLPHSRFCMAPPAEAPEVNELPALSRGTVTLGCFQELTKLNDRVLRIWARAMDGMPGVRLRVQSTRLAKAEDRSRFRERLQTAGIDTSRCELVPPSDRVTYLRAHHEIDFILDSFPYTGGTTTTEALWMGVPTLTLARPGMLGRQGEAHLRNVGLDDWVAHDEDDFVKRAIRHASPEGLQALAALRSELRERCRVSPLFDNVRFAADWTLALKAMHTEFLSNPPQEP